jgi:archaellum biogenesis ATPase FlaH
VKAIAQPQARKLTTGIPGLDHILDGGMPELSICIVAGPSGTGKTVLTQQIVHANASPNRKVLCLTTLSEPPMKRYSSQLDVDGCRWQSVRQGGAGSPTRRL